MIVTLEVSDNKSKVRRVTLKSDAIIGRSADCNLRIASGQVSRHHCKIGVTDTQVSVKDLGSSNGTFLNGEALPPNEVFPISSGAQITVGPVRFVARFEQAQNTLGSPGSTVEIPIVPDGQTAAEALAQQAKPVPEQVSGGAVARAIEAAAKAEQQAPQQVDELLELVKQPQQPPADTDEDEFSSTAPADSAAEQVIGSADDESADATDEQVTPKPGSLEVALPSINANPDGDETVDWSETGPGSPSGVRPSPSSLPVAKAVGSTVEIPEIESDSDSAPAEPREPAGAEAAAAGEVQSFEFDEAVESEPTFDFVDPTSNADDDEYEAGSFEEEIDVDESAEQKLEVAADEPDEAEAPKKQKGKRSLFGLLGRKKQAEPAAADEAVEQVETEADEAQDAEAEVAAEEDEEYEYEYEYEEVPVDEAGDEETVNVSEDEIASYLDGEEDESPPGGNDSTLGDFLKKLGDS